MHCLARSGRAAASCWGQSRIVAVAIPELGSAQPWQHRRDGGCLCCCLAEQCSAAATGDCAPAEAQLQELHL